MHIHILGIAGTFMGGLAALAKELNFKVTGSDCHIYPPMSTQLEELGISYLEGYGEEALSLKPDLFVVGNVMKRGHPIIESILNQGLKTMSGPEWLANYVLPKRHVLAVSGTHGKTTTSSMLAWILEKAGFNPGFLIGGIPQNFEQSAKLGQSPYFVIEADEYDSAFFDKRSKFIHYHPRTLILNNLEYDHADIFPNLEAIQTQFHHLIRTIPSQGRIIYPSETNSIEAVLNKGVWSETQTVGREGSAQWFANRSDLSGTQFEVYFEGKKRGEVVWTLLGQHNISNALAAIAAAYHVGVSVETSTKALSEFKGVKRRLEIKGTVNNITVYDDFAHHPTAIQTTLQGLRAKLGESSSIIAVVDLRSNTMRAGHHQKALRTSFVDATKVYFYKPEDISWDVAELQKAIQKPGFLFTDSKRLLETLSEQVKPYDQIVFMSNGGFSNIQTDFLNSVSDTRAVPL